MPKRPTVSVRITVEQLEDRLALSTSTGYSVPISSGSVSSSLHRGTLNIVGTSGADVIQLKERAGRVRVAGRSFQANKVKRVTIATDQGNDVITIDSRFRKSCQIYAGAGDDFVSSGRGDDVIRGEGGRDTLLGGGGNDLIYGGLNDNTLDGGSGANTIVQKAPFASQSATDMSSEIIRLVNLERSKQGLKPFYADFRLVYVAGLHARNMAERSEVTSLSDALRHTLDGVKQPTLVSRLDSVRFPTKTGLENIAYGYDTAADVVAAWMESPSHRANILSPSVNLTGIGVAANGEGVVYFCQVFAAKN